jgi:hypothetical protein
MGGGDMGRWMLRVALPAGAMAAALLLLSAGAGTAATVGKVVALNGTCFVDRLGARTPLVLGQPLDIADTVEAPPNAQVKLRMGDGSVISVAAGTEMTIAAYRVSGTGQRLAAVLNLRRGLLRTTVTEVAPAAPFEIKTPTVSAVAYSGDWFTETGSNRIGVLRGSVVVTSAATRRSETIPARWGARVEPELDPVPPRPWSQDEFEAVIARTNVK